MTQSGILPTVLRIGFMGLQCSDCEFMHYSLRSGHEKAEYK